MPEFQSLYVYVKMPLYRFVCISTLVERKTNHGVCVVHLKANRMVVAEMLKMYWITSNYGLYSWIKYDSDAKFLAVKRFYNFIFCTHDSLLLFCHQRHNAYHTFSGMKNIHLKRLHFCCSHTIVYMFWDGFGASSGTPKKKIFPKKRKKNPISYA